MMRMQHLDDYRARAAEAAAFLHGRGMTPIDVVVECGSGLSGLATVLLTDPVEYAACQIDHNPYGDGHAANSVCWY